LDAQGASSKQALNVDKKTSSRIAKAANTSAIERAAKITKREAKAFADAKAAKAKRDYGRVVKMRDDRLELGLKRHDVYVHDDDWQEIKDLVASKHLARQILQPKPKGRPASGGK